MAILNKLEFDSNKDITIIIEPSYCCMECGGNFERGDGPTVYGTVGYYLTYEELKSLHNVIETAMFMMEGRK